MARAEAGADACPASRLGEALRATAPQFRFAFDDALELFGGSLLIAARPADLESQLAYRVANGDREEDSTDHFIGEGDWRLLSQPVDNQRVALEIRQLLAADLAFRETERYRLYHHAVTHGRVNHFHHTDFDSVEKLDSYFEDLCRLIVMAGRFGILPRPEARLSAAIDIYPSSRVRPLWQELSERNIGVAIDASGGLVRVGPGKHRLAVARALGLISVPCEVRMIHADLLRASLAKTGGDAAAAVRHCVAEAAAARQAAIDAEEGAAARLSGQTLALALRADPKTGGRFLFSRQEVPSFVGSRLLVEIEASAVGHGLDAPAGLFLGKGDWSGLLRPVVRGETPDDDENEEPSDPLPPFAAVRMLPYRIALAADGRVLALAGQERGLPCRGRVVAEVAMIHAAFLRANRQPGDATLWDAVQRSIFTIAARPLYPRPAPLPDVPAPPSPASGDPT